VISIQNARLQYFNIKINTFVALKRRLREKKTSWKFTDVIVSQKTSYLWLAITLKYMNRFKQ